MRANAPDSTSFNIQVWEIVNRVPVGKVTTYGYVASLIPLPADVGADEYKAASARWVGAAMANCPDEVPWQRVINAQGKISERRGGGSLRQRQLLEEEGVVFDDKDRVDLKKYSWSAKPDAPDESEQPSLL
jgi:methylated-DNA-protein-cysteine methyltransferase related protein